MVEIIIECQSTPQALPSKQFTLISVSIIIWIFAISNFTSL
jgi:hypothetical protein